MGRILCVATAWIVWAVGAPAATYHVSPRGDDDRDGLTPATAWRTVQRVNTADLQPGDQVLFERGGEWRESLRPQRGAEGAPILYGAYGEGPKPLFTGSVLLNRVADWQPAGEGLWTTVGPQPTGRVVLAADSLGRLGLHREQGAEASGRLSADGYVVTCATPGQAGNHIQLVLAPFEIEQGKVYELSFRARSSQPLKLLAPHLMMRDPPWRSYGAGRTKGSWTVGPEWVECRQHYLAAVTAADARLTFYLGDVLPAGAALTIADLNLTECEGGDPLPVDVGNIIFDHGRACGVKKWQEADLAAEFDYWYDEARHLVKLRLNANPAERYDSIELALARHLVDQSNAAHVIYENLAFRYGAAHGIGGGNTHHIVVRDCDFGWIGGADQFGGDRTVRYGNGVEFWGNAHDNLVERCRLWEIYDAALTNQSSGANAVHRDIIYRNNVVWNCEYSFEYWNNPETAVTENIVFAHNTCVNAGHGWSHGQRPDPNGRQLCFYTNRAATRGIRILNNIFYEARTVAFDAFSWPVEVMASPEVILLDHNAWAQAEGTMIRFKDKSYTMAQFADYQRDTGQERHSVVGDPRFVDLAGRRFGLLPNSPCVDAGLEIGYEGDFVGTKRSVGRAPDIGAYELAGP